MSISSALQKTALRFRYFVFTIEDTIHRPAKGSIQSICPPCVKLQDPTPTANQPRPSPDSLFAPTKMASIIQTVKKIHKSTAAKARSTPSRRRVDVSSRITCPCLACPPGTHDSQAKRMKHLIQQSFPLSFQRELHPNNPFHPVFP